MTERNIKGDGQHVVYCRVSMRHQRDAGLGLEARREAVRGFRVSRTVNSVKNDGPECVEAIA